MVDEPEDQAPQLSRALQRSREREVSKRINPVNLETEGTQVRMLEAEAERRLAAAKLVPKTEKR